MEASAACGNRKSPAAASNSGDLAAQAPTVGFGCSVQGLDPALLGLFFTRISTGPALQGLFFTRISTGPAQVRLSRAYFSRGFPTGPALLGLFFTHFSTGLVL